MTPARTVPDYTPGTILYYPAHGVGEFITLEETRVGGEPLRVLVVEFSGGLTIKIPPNKAAQEGLQTLKEFAAPPELAQALKITTDARKAPSLRAGQWKRRREELERRITGRHITDLAKAVRDLRRDAADTTEPTSGERELLQKALRRLVTVIMHARRCSSEDALHLLQEISRGKKQPLPFTEV